MMNFVLYRLFERGKGTWVLPPVQSKSAEKKLAKGIDKITVIDYNNCAFNPAGCDRRFSFNNAADLPTWDA